MRAIFSGICVALVIALLAGGIYYLMQEPVYRAQPMQSVRVGDPGHNLVGSNWTGNPQSRGQPENGSEGHVQVEGRGPS